MLGFHDSAFALSYGRLQAKEFVLGVMSLSEETFRELSIARLRELLKGGLLWNIRAVGLMPRRLRFGTVSAPY